MTKLLLTAAFLITTSANVFASMCNDDDHIGSRNLFAPIKSFGDHQPMIEVSDCFAITKGESDVQHIAKLEVFFDSKFEVEGQRDDFESNMAVFKSNVAIAYALWAHGYRR